MKNMFYFQADHLLREEGIYHEQLASLVRGNHTTFYIHQWFCSVLRRYITVWQLTAPYDFSFPFPANHQ